jgi:hypothetical protein
MFTLLFFGVVFFGSISGLPRELYHAPKVLRY